MEMKLIDDLISALKSNAIPVKDVRVGISWTGVDGKYCGVAKTYGIPFKHGNYTKDLGELNSKTTLELAKYSRSWNMVEASIGVAAINSMVKPKGKININALDLVIERGKDKEITMVGRFPLIPKIKASASRLWVLESDHSLINPKKGIINESAAEYVIPKSDIVIITGSTLINKSMERFLNLCNEDTYVIILGPSTTMSEVLFDYGANMLAGVEIIKSRQILQKISQSGGMINSKICKNELIYRVMED